MQENRISTMAYLALVIGVLAVSIGTADCYYIFRHDRGAGKSNGWKNDVREYDWD
jgi:hypothetical protein